MNKLLKVVESMHVNDNAVVSISGCGTTVIVEGGNIRGCIMYYFGKDPDLGVFHLEGKTVCCHWT